ncbi:hypothetical protein F4604DRAFT_1975809 [Suillus subluteus]|nr:hypothetical protein F4604DRAFT_1975809 [Suillus subluteus]
MKRGFQRDADAARELLSEVLDVCHADSHIHRAALLAIRTSAQHQAGSATANDLGQEQLTAFVLLLMPDQLAKQAVWCHRRDEPHALDEVISLHYDALKCYNTVDAYRGQLLSNLSAIALQREALDLQPVSHTFRFSLDNLANQLSTRFEHRGNNKDLDQAIALCREVLALHPVGHTDQSLSLHGLANLLSSCFEQQGNDEDLDQAIALQREVLALCPVGHTAQSSSLKDLDQAIALHGEALALCLIGHTDRFISLNNLANILSSCFEHQGDKEGLDQAIALQREALAWHPVGHTDRFKSRIDSPPALGTEAMMKTWIRLSHWTGKCWLCAQLVTQIGPGNEEDLDQAIALHREVLALHPVGHTDRSLSLNNLANELSSRFEHRGHDKDLDQAIALHREALALCLTCSDHAAALVKKFRDLSSLLDKPPVNNQEATSRVNAEAEEAWYRHLVKDWNGAVEEIQKIEGFSCFLLPPSFSNL